MDSSQHPSHNAVYRSCRDRLYSMSVFHAKPQSELTNNGDFGGHSENSLLCIQVGAGFHTVYKCNKFCPPAINGCCCLL